MPLEWRATCKDCPTIFTYSDAVLAERAARGLSAPERCSAHRSRHAVETQHIASSHFGLEPIEKPSLLGHPFLGSFDRSHRLRPEVQEVAADDSAMDLGITDAHVGEIYSALESNRVLVIVAPTGAGKSTVIPFRLLSPTPESGLAPNHFTRQGRKIIVTQPRRDAASSIPATIASKMHGSTVGPGSEIGYRHAEIRDQTDSWNRMIFLTDGTLANWLIDQRAAEFSIVIVDEAHERSATIDLILGLMRTELLKRPHLTLIILSATIHAEGFRDFFEAAVPGKVWLKDFADCQKTHGYEVVWPTGPVVSPQGMNRAVVEKILDLLRTTTEGDILAFLPGEPEIKRVVTDLQRDMPPALRTTTVLEPYFGALSGQDRERVKRQVKPRRDGVVPRRVVIATNLAETSLTLPAVVHVIDTGLIKEPVFDPVSRSESMKLIWHSQAGCRQRWGRAGRNRPGIVYPLYTQDQFEEFEPFTKPAVVREALDEIYIKAKRGGSSSLKEFPWLDAPPKAEIERVQGMAVDRRFVDEDEDLTERGSEIFDLYHRISPLAGEGPGASARGLAMASLLALADRYGCLIEAATFLVAAQFLGERSYSQDRMGIDRGCFVFDREWEAEEVDRVARIHGSFRAGCRDDLDFALKVVALTEGVEHLPRSLGGEDWARESRVNLEVLRRVLEERDRILEVFNRKVHGVPIRKLDFSLFERLRLVIGLAWPDMKRRLSGDGTWQDPRSDERGLISIHSACHHHEGEAAIAAFGRRVPEDNGAYSSDPIASVIVRIQGDEADLDDWGLIARVRSIRSAGDDARRRLLADVETPVGTVFSFDGKDEEVVRWFTDADGQPRLESKIVQGALKSSDVAEGEEVEFQVSRSIPFLPTGRPHWVLGSVRGRTCKIFADDLAFGGPPPPTMLHGGVAFKLAVIDRSEESPKLSLLPLIETEWKQLRSSRKIKGTITELQLRQSGEALVRVMIPSLELPGVQLSATAVLGPRQRMVIQTMAVGKQIEFQADRTDPKEWIWNLKQVEDESESDRAQPELLDLEAHGVVVAGATARTKTRLSVSTLYAAVQTAPSFERAIRGLFWKCHELNALPHTVETSATLKRAKELDEVARNQLHRVWKDGIDDVRKEARTFKTRLSSEVISGSSMHRLEDIAVEILQIADARFDAEINPQRAKNKREWVERDQSRLLSDIKYRESRIEKNSSALLYATSLTYRAKLEGWVKDDKSILNSIYVQWAARKNEWEEALALAAQWEKSASAARNTLDTLRKKRRDAGD